VNLRDRHVANISHGAEQIACEILDHWWEIGPPQRVLGRSRPTRTLEFMRFSFCKVD
jgi:hypothetical protein